MTKMKNRIRIILPLCLLLFGSCITTKVIREDTEWSDFWWSHESDVSKPRVLFIGNSITRGYYPAVSAKLAEKANCDRYSTSRSIEDLALLQETKIAMGKYNHTVIHFNNGLHGWHLTGEQYEEGLRKFVRFLIAQKSRDCKLVYSLTTPVSSKEPGVKLDSERNTIVMERNSIALKVMKENGIQVIDLYGLMEPELEKYNSSKGDLHYKREGYELMADHISREILKLIENRK
ncbi:MAG TPA: hypothetical protein DD458_24450 [Prolixibacteraceae bacterium]|nr:hypothetical protein [Prolixibacteraceae bacterium]HCU60006.1 hypothetical protein [Prolixibacteraceae bacterium]